MRDDIIAIVCPDVHGRDFWEPVAKEYDGSVPFIFLGDYLDPYFREGIDEKTALNTLYRIWHFRCMYKNSVVLLLGNHDLSYCFDNARRVRYCYEIEEEAVNFMTTFFKDFKVAHEIKDNGKTFLFTHAGVNPLWLENEEFEQRYDAEYIESLFRENVQSFFAYSHFRGHPTRFAGSPLWADIREFDTSLCDADKFPEDLMQIVGHTQLVRDKLEFPYICDIDSRKVYVITKDHKIEPYYNEKATE